ncbi:hypothetical protein QAD02_021528 [Eretmocerus hayati]|uniref:Uncharacterized protein n=1 Tax=Eretmocerus hayati TaxID=131215 RepID=A0ACC2PQ58_9HYME|nr:hypothetical protein QAD02_021528 [Eretmocerus hayati]
MDDFVEGKLKAWNSEQYVEKFISLWEVTFLPRGSPKDLQTQFELYAPSGFDYGHELWCIDYKLANPNVIDFPAEFNIIIPFIMEIAKERNRFSELLKVLESRGQDHLAALLSLPKLLGVRRSSETQPTKGAKTKHSASNNLAKTPVPEKEGFFGSEL